jgi:ribosomal protein S15P/S13E
MLKKSDEKQEEKPKKLTLEEYEKKVIELANKGLTSEKIGEELKKQNIHSKEYNKKISKILGEKYINPDLKNTEEKLKKIEKHMEKNKQDKRATRERSRVFSQVRKVKKYFKKI